ncbi:MAG: hypothetical protein LBV51_03620 [Acholeplasmatales bacterium]|jgi:hypothetical protein|nr:hypothetical protein [Acholeplasmatales bacterium]
MIRKITLEEALENVSYAYNLALDIKNSCYPGIYFNNINSQKVFYDNVVSAAVNTEYFLFEQNNKKYGFIQLYRIDEDKYIGITELLISRYYNKAITELISYLHIYYNGYFLYYGFPINNKKALSYVISNKEWSLLDDTYHFELFLKNYEIKTISHKFVKIDKNNFNLFSSIHDYLSPDMYWDSTHIYNDLENWNILVYIDNFNITTHAIYYCVFQKEAEIYGIDYLENNMSCDIYKSLLNASLNNMKLDNSTKCVYFCEITEQKLTKEAGFDLISHYRCYKVKI